MRGALLSFSLLVIVSAVLEAVLPPSGGKRAFHVLAAVVLFSALLSPLKSFDLSALDPEVLLTQRQEFSENAERENETALLLAASVGWKNAALDTLQSADVTGAQVDVLCDVQDGQVVLQKLTVRGIAPQQAALARRTLHELCGDSARISIITEEPQ